MGQIGEIIAGSARLARRYADGVLKGVRPEQFARLARQDGKPVASNHAAFVFGHLSLYPPQVLQLMGKASGVLPPLPSRFAELFSGGKECRDDPEGTIYPPMEEITRYYFAATDAAIEAVAKAPDAEFLKPNPTEGRMKETFPLVGGVVNFYMTAHPMSHIGQVSAWRRFMGLGAVF
jgi:hypothetical protein